MGVWFPKPRTGVLSQRIAFSRDPKTSIARAVVSTSESGLAETFNTSFSPVSGLTKLNSVNPSLKSRAMMFSTSSRSSRLGASFFYSTRMLKFGDDFAY
jgi:hypothetical protein